MSLRGDAGRLVASLIALCVVTGAASAARAEQAAGTTQSPKRPVPDISGLQDEPTTAADVLLWVPRLLIAPLYLFNEYVLRWPLSVIVPPLERAEIPRRAYDLFTFFPDHRAGIVPVAFADFGFKPSVGVLAFWDNAGFEGNNLRLHVGAWPPDWIAGSLGDHIRLDDAHSLVLRVKALHRPDRSFFGLGPRSQQSFLSRFTDSRVEGNAAFVWRFWRESRLAVGAGARAVELSDGRAGTDPSVTQEAATGAFALPYGFGRGYTEVHERIAVVLDTRKTRRGLAGARAPGGSGGRIEGVLEQGSDVRRAPDSGWLRYGATATGLLDLNGAHRVLSLSATVLFADPLGSGQIPFTELVQLGGDHLMPGFYQGRLIDRSAAVATLKYDWPVNPFLNGTLQAAVGNVLGTRLAAFEPGVLRFSGAFGVSVAGLSDPPLEVLIGVGTETFDHGGQADSVRVMVGVPYTMEH